MQKEKLSALMDGELIDNEFISDLSGNKDLQQGWLRYHLVRDTLRGDVNSVMHFDIADRVAAAIALEPAQFVPETQFIPEAQPKPETWHTLPFWHKVRPWFAHIGQAGVAAGVSLAVIIGVQNYNQDTDVTQPDLPSFSTFSIGGMTSPVSYGLNEPEDQQTSSGILAQDQRKRITILQDYELQRRINAEPQYIQVKDVQAVGQ